MGVALGYLKTKVQQKLQSDPFFSEEEMVASINEGIDEIVAFARHTNDIASANTEIDPTTNLFRLEYALPPDFMFIRGVTLDDVDLREMTHEEWRGTGSPTSDVVGTPSKFFIRNNEVVGLYPRPDSVANIKIYYIRKPDDLVNDTDESNIPRVFSRAVVHYACYDLLLNDGRKEDAENHFQKWLLRRAEASLELNMNRKRKVRRTIL